MASNNQRGRSGNNNNPEGRNQYSGWTDTARDRPMTAAAVAAAAVGAGVFLWSRRDQISNQLSQISDQIGQWNEGRHSGQDQGMEMAGSSTSNMGTGSTATGSNL